MHLYSVRDDPQDRVSSSSRLPSNVKRSERTVAGRTTIRHDPGAKSGSSSQSSSYAGSESGSSSFGMDEGEDEDDSDDAPGLEDVSDSDEEMAEEDIDEMELDMKLKKPVILSRRRFHGACNVETVKDGK